jgi:hypothetical protein
MAGAGTQTSALAISGNKPGTGITPEVESWNGSSWTEVGDVNTQRYILSASGADNTVALAFGGDTPPVTGATESWNGSSWTEVADLSVARKQLAGNGTTNTTAIAFGGAPPVTGATEEFQGAGAILTRTFTLS